jgi:mRNA interferase HigB
MNVIALKRIKEFARKYSDVRDAIFSWYHEASAAEWSQPRDIKERYHTASFVGNNLVIFNIKGIKYRLVTKVSYSFKTVFIKWIGPHSEYDKLDFNGGHE